MPGCNGMCGLKDYAPRPNNVKETVNAQLFPVEVYPLVARCYAAQFFNNVVNVAYTQAVIRELEGDCTNQIPRELTILYMAGRDFAQSLDMWTSAVCSTRRQRVTQTSASTPADMEGAKLEIVQELRELHIVPVPGPSAACWVSCEGFQPLPRRSKTRGNARMSTHVQETTPTQVPKTAPVTRNIAHLFGGRTPTVSSGASTTVSSLVDTIVLDSTSCTNSTRASCSKTGSSSAGKRKYGSKSTRETGSSSAGKAGSGTSYAGNSQYWDTSQSSDVLPVHRFSSQVTMSYTGSSTSELTRNATPQASAIRSQANASTVPTGLDSVAGEVFDDSSQIKEGTLGHLWKLQLHNAAQAYARGAPNLPALIPLHTFRDASGLLEKFIPFFAWIIADANPSAERSDMVRLACAFEEWQVLKSFPRILIMQDLKPSCAFTLAQVGVLFAVDSLLRDASLVENNFLLRQEVISMRSYRANLCDVLKPHMHSLLSRFVQFEDMFHIEIKKAWHYANELYRAAHQPPAMKKIFERGEPFRLAMGREPAPNVKPAPVYALAHESPRSLNDDPVAMVPARESPQSRRAKPTTHAPAQYSPQRRNAARAIHSLPRDSPHNRDDQRAPRSDPPCTTYSPAQDAPRCAMPATHAAACDSPWNRDAPTTHSVARDPPPRNRDVIPSAPACVHQIPVPKQKQRIVYSTNGRTYFARNGDTVFSKPKTR